MVRKRRSRYYGSRRRRRSGKRERFGSSLLMGCLLVLFIGGIGVFLLVHLIETVSVQSMLLVSLVIALIVVAFAGWRIRKVAQKRHQQLARQQLLQEEHIRVETVRREEVVRAQRQQQAHLCTLSEVLQLSPTGFEDYVGTLLKKSGYGDVKRVGGSGDRGADIIAYNIHHMRVVVQCKLYTPGHLITSPELQKFLGALVAHRAYNGIYVTTSSFTGPAQALARAQGQSVRLIDGPQLVQWMEGKLLF